LVARGFNPGNKIGREKSSAKEVEKRTKIVADEIEKRLIKTMKKI